MNSLFENRNSFESYDEIRNRLKNAICPSCGWVSNHESYPRCEYRDGYESTGNPFQWR
jgi:hypothetical protein